MDDVLSLLIPQVRRFASTELDAAAIDRASAIPEAVRRKAAELGLFGVTIPEQDGGLGLGLAEACQVVAELARRDRSVAVSIGLHLGLGTRALVELGSEALRREWLPRLASGESIASFCATEPAAGSDLTRVLTTAERVDGELVLRGEKSYVTNGGFAGAFTVLARTPGLGGARATSLLFVPRDTAGVVIGPEEHKLGIRGSSTVTVRFEDARVPLGNVLGEPGKGLEAAHRSLEWGRTIMSAGCIGTARAALELTIGQVTTRRQFGKVLCELGLVQEHLAFMASRLFAMEAIVERVGELEAAGQDIATVSAIAKVFCSEGAFDLSDRAIQLHGALGFIEDTGVAMLLRDCRVTRIFEGTNDVLLVHLGASAVARPEALGLRLHAPGTCDEARAWDGVEARLRGEAEALRRLHGVMVIRHPRLLARVARAMSALAVASTALRQGDRLGGDADARGRHAAGLLVHEAQGWLDGLARAEADDGRDRALVETLTRDLLAAPRPGAREPISREVTQ